jgi:hypothetical protein
MGRFLIVEAILEKNRCGLTITVLLIGILSRIIPHIPNTTAILFSSAMLGYVLPRYKACFLVVFMGIVSDIFVSFVYHYPLLGTWTLFTYSAFIATAYTGRFFKKLPLSGLFISLLSISLLFWVWTNLGVWLLSGLYPHTRIGLVACYVLALPFLKNQIWGDSLWASVFVCMLGYCSYYQKLKRSFKRVNYVATTQI